MFITVQNTHEIGMAIQNAIDECTFNHIEAARNPKAFKPRQTEHGTVCKVYPPDAKETRFMVCFGDATNVMYFNTRGEATDAIATWIFGTNVNRQWVELPIYQHMRDAEIIKVNRTRVRIAYDNPKLGTRVEGWRPLVRMFGEAIIPETAKWTIEGSRDNEASHKRGYLVSDEVGGSGMYVAR